MPTDLKQLVIEEFSGENAQTLFGALAVAVGFIGYLPYFRDIFRGKTKPHRFSWLVWTVIEGTIFFAQVSRGAGAGAWITALTALQCATVFGLALRWGEKNITKMDWICLFGALSGIGIWLATENPLWAVVILTLTDTLGFAPTFRKSYKKPYEETPALYALSSVKLVFALFALQSVSLTTALYPASLILTNGLFVIMLLWRRRMLSARQA